MSQETSAKDVAVRKLSIDRPDDFRFHAAYHVYSEAWDRTSSEEVRLKLNEMIGLLSRDEISYQKFYEMVGPYRADPRHYRGRVRIRTQRKREWRRKAKRSARNARHRR